jgi:FkbM family methyltransferase
MFSRSKSSLAALTNSIDLTLWSAKQIRNKTTFRLWYLKQVLKGEPELRLVSCLSDPNRVTLDVGSNRGLYVLAALPFSKGVMAFEPQPHLAGFLRRFLPRTVRVFELAASDADGNATLLVPANPRSHEEARLSTPGDGRLRAAAKYLEVTVEKKRLDDIVVEPVGLIKIDVEGHELSVLEGASKLIESYRPNIIIEIEERHRAGARTSTFRWFEDKRYRGYVLKNGTLVSQKEPGEQSKQGPQEPYVYNFIFLPEERAPALRPSLWGAMAGLLV